MQVEAYRNTIERLHTGYQELALSTGTIPNMHEVMAYDYSKGNTPPLTVTSTYRHARNYLDDMHPDLEDRMGGLSRAIAYSAGVRVSVE